MSAQTKLSAKFQISIPKSVRTAQHWQAGQIFAFIPKGEGVLLLPVAKREELAGLARGANTQGIAIEPTASDAGHPSRLGLGLAPQDEA